MRIRKAISTLRQEKKKEYDQHVSEFMRSPLDDLVDFLDTNIRGTHYTYPDGESLTLLPSSGCAYWSSGCSMCNYQSPFTKGLAAMKALGMRDPQKYAEMMEQEFRRLRKDSPDPYPDELISVYDSLSDKEMPPLARKAVYGSTVFSKAPGYVTIETRASNITREKLREVRSYYGSGTTIALEFGVEVADEWLRTHWLNKGILNRQIEDAVTIAHECGCIVTPDVIIGIPGLAECQSKQLFVETMAWLESIGVDKYKVLPLNRKDYTLQGYLYEHLRDSPELTRVGIVDGAHTGLPWLYTVASAMLALDPGVAKRVHVSQVLPSTNSTENTVSYNADASCGCNPLLRNAITSTHDGVDLVRLADALKKAEQDPCFSVYQKVLQRQGTQKISDTLNLVANEVAKSIWPAWQGHYDGFEKELNGYETRM